MLMPLQRLTEHLVKQCWDEGNYVVNHWNMRALTTQILLPMTVSVPDGTAWSR